MKINYCQLASLVVKRKLIHSKTIHQNDVHSTNPQWSLHCYKLVLVDRINYASCSPVPTIGFKFTYLGFKKVNGVNNYKVSEKLYMYIRMSKQLSLAIWHRKIEHLLMNLCQNKMIPFPYVERKQRECDLLETFEWTLIACMLNLFASFTPRECDFSHTISCSSWHVWGNFVVSSITMYNI